MGISTGNLTQAAGLPRYDWLRGVCGDARIGIIHRFILVGFGLHRRDSGYDALAGEIGVDHTAVCRALDAGVRFGWLVDSPGRVPRNFAFTFPQGGFQGAQGGPRRAVIKAGARP